MTKWGFGFQFDMELETPLDFFDVVYKNGEKVRYDKRPRGTWTEEFDESENPFFQRRWRCSACNDYNYYGRPEFCPHCGADMREGDEK